MTDVAVLVGSLRRDSINRKLAIALGKLAAPRLTFRSSICPTCRCTTTTSSRTCPSPSPA